MTGRLADIAINCQKFNHLCTLGQETLSILLGYVYLDQLMHRVFFSIENCGRNFFGGGGLRSWLLGTHALNEKREKWFGTYRSSGSPKGCASRTGRSGAVLLHWGHGSLRTRDSRGRLSCTSTTATVQEQ